jgi:N-acetyl-anhydromuramyl-L-alanine amidase AmpD
LQIINHPSPNYFSGIKAKIQAIVLHGTAGNLQSSLDELTNPKPNNPDSRVSSNYVIGLDGSIYRLVSYWLGQRAWANGVLNYPDRSISWLVECAIKGLNPNNYTISIEHVANSRDMINRNYSAMPAVQLEASKMLVKRLLKDTGLTANHQTIIGHNQIDSISRSNCPGIINIPEYIANI